MKEYFDYFSKLTIKQWFILVYVSLSIASLCVADSTPLWIIALIVLNLANATRLLKQLPEPEE